MKFAVIGNPIAHSLSPMIHQNFAKQICINISYSTILGDLITFESQIYNFFLQGGFGLNVTAPFKERAFAIADLPTPRCQQAKAANTLWMNQGLLYADNTDGIGFIRDITHHRPLSGQSILILGAGGAARGIIGPLLAQKPNCVMIFNRSLEKTQDLIKDFPDLQSYHDNIQSFDIIINTTSANFLDAQNLFPQVFNPNTFCYDLNYDKQKLTNFIVFARQNGCEGIDGIGMLMEQAAEAFGIWHKMDVSFILNQKVNQRYAVKL
jgi:shikimate dehydrogenase